jgi:hypothetical protein
MTLSIQLELQGVSLPAIKHRRMRAHLRSLERRLKNRLLVLRQQADQRRVEADLRMALGPLGPTLVSHQAAETSRREPRRRRPALRPGQPPDRPGCPVVWVAPVSLRGGGASPTAHAGRRRYVRRARIQSCARPPVDELYRSATETSGPTARPERQLREGCGRSTGGRAHCRPATRRIRLGPRAPRAVGPSVDRLRRPARGWSARERTRRLPDVLWSLA